MKNSTLFSNENRYKYSLYCCLEALKNAKLFLVLILFMGLFMQGVSAQGTLTPACNLTGPLTACAVSNPSDTSGDITITATVARSGAGATLTYSFVSNSSGAIIRLPLAPQVYNAVTNVTTQTLQVYPGAGVPEFNLQLNVVNTQSSPNTICSCSKSVSISKVTADSSFSPIVCFGQLSTLQANGHFSDVGTYTYTLPGFPSNATGTFPGLAGSVGGITYTVTVESAEGCVTSTSQTITQPAPQPPVFDNCTDGSTALGCNPTPPSCGTFTARNCNGSVPVTCSPGTITINGCNRTQIFTYTATDPAPGSTLSSTCLKTFTWTEDTTVPVITATGTPTSGTLGCNPTTAQINAALGSATATDNCGAVSPTFADGTVSSQGCSRSQTRTWNVTDACGNVAVSVSRTATWTEATPLVFTCAGDKTIECSAAFVFDLPTVSDGCGGTPVITILSTVTNANGSQTRTWQAVDACGNMTTCTQTISVLSCSHIFPTQTTCCNFVTGTATGLYNVCTTVAGLGTTGGTVTNAIPGVMFYYSGIVAPAANFTIDVKQTNDGDLSRLFEIHGYDKNSLSQIRLSTGSCGYVAFRGSFIDSGHGARYVVSGATPGATYIISIKYSVKSLIGGVYSGSDRTSTYTFASYLNGSVTPADNTSGTINAVSGCSDNTPLPGACTIPVAKQSSVKDSIEATVYPNPFANNFKLDVKTNSDEVIQVKVFDMLGKLIETSFIQTPDIETFEIGNNYKSGIYNVIVTQGTEVRTQRVIKK